MIIAIAILVVFAVVALYRHIAMVNKLMNDSHKKIMSSLDSIKTFFTVTLIDKISGAFQDDSTIDDNDDMSDS
jgi:tellurite resistance protein TehA-like permease